MNTVEFAVPNIEDDSSVDEPFMNKKRFSRMVESAVIHKRLDYMDAIVHICEETGIEVEDVKKYLSTHIVEKVEGEALKLNCLDKEHYRMEYTRTTLFE
jgi:uncharacterized protein YwgA